MQKCSSAPSLGRASRSRRRRRERHATRERPATTLQSTVSSRAKVSSTLSLSFLHPDFLVNGHAPGYRGNGIDGALAAELACPAVVNPHLYPGKPLNSVAARGLAA